MNKKINNLSYDELIFVDIETVRGLETFDENSPYYDVWAWKQRNKETNEIPETSAVIESYYNKAALFAEWGKIVCISVGYIHNEELHITSFTGDESDILNRYIDMMKKQGRMAVGHNLIAFDNNYIRKRWFINGLGEYLSDKLGNDVYQKPWLLDDALFDTMVAWKGAGYSNTSLDELAMCFNIPSSKDQLHGNEVSSYFYNGRISEIQSYCERDVSVVANIVRCWKGDKILIPIIKEIKEELEIVDNRAFLEKLYSNNSFTSDLEEELKSLIGKKKLTKADKVNLFTILRGVLLRNDFINMDQDNKATKQEKEEQVTNFINSL